MIEFHNVTKRYGKNTALDDVTISITEPGLYCLLGKNGAGKTTFMKLIAGYLNASKGMIAVDGATVSTHSMPERVNFIEATATQFNMDVDDLITAAARLRSTFDRDFALVMAQRFGLDLTKKFKHLSFGMKAMLNTILALASNSEVILLDEPTLGFDAIMRKQFNDLLIESYEAHPRIIIVSTHLIEEIAKVAQQIIIINDGSILLQTGIDDVDEDAYSLTGPEPAVLEVLNEAKDLNVIGSTHIGSMMAAYIYGERVSVPAGSPVAIDKLGLEDFFINLVGGTK